MHRSQLLAAIVESSDDAIFAFDEAGTIVSWNRGAELLYGYRAEQIIGGPSALIVPPELRDEGDRLTQRVLAGETIRQHHTVRLTRSGARVEISASLSPLRDEGGGIIGGAVIHRDITESRQNEERLRQQARLFDWLNDSVLATDEQLRVTIWNRASEALYGWRSDEVVGRKTPDLLRTRPIGADREEVLAELRNGGAWFGECVQSRKDGTAVRVETAAVALKDAAGAFRGIITVNRDVTARYAAQEESRLREDLLAEAQRIAQVGSWTWHIGTRRFDWSAELARLCAVPSESENPAATFLARVHPEDRSRVVAAIRAARRSAAPFELEHRLQLPDGTVRRVLARCHVEVAEDGHVIRLVGTSHDVTERLQLEARVQQADRMASLGLLAAGVAHEINNPLSYVISNLQFAVNLVRKLPPASVEAGDVGMLQALDDAVHGAGRVRDIVRDLHTFARTEEVSTKVFELPGVLEAAATLASNQVRHRARLIKDYGASPAVLGSEARLVQVFVNLLVNAAQAIPEGQAEQHQIRVVVSTDERGWAAIEISDTGAGIPNEVMGRLFDPFFTTKPVGVGTGLGLSICQGIVSSMGGTIRVRSEVGQGTTMRVCLPPADADAPRLPAMDSGEVRAPPRQGCEILVIDDEPRILTAIRRALAGEHHVTTATSGDEALQILLGPTTFDVVFCDVMMPKVTGIELYERLLRLRPAAAGRVVFVTGGVFSAEAKTFLERFPGRVLEKPVNANQLLAALDVMVRTAPEQTRQ